ncbi:hypothetical protein FKM82_000294 [Ascaphus truei]
MYNAMWNMDELVPEYAKIEALYGSDLMFYIEMEAPGNYLAFFLPYKYIRFVTLVSAHKVCTFLFPILITFRFLFGPASLLIFLSDLHRIYS